MGYFDLHCDTILTCLDQKKTFRNNGLHIDLNKATVLPYVQCAAVFVFDSLRGEAAYDHFLKAYSYMKELAEKDKFTFIMNKEDLISVTENKSIGIIPTIEGGAAVAGSLEKLDKVIDMGVKMMTLTWNGSNEIGSGIGDPDADFGLTEFGKKAVRRMGERNMIVDISHASEKLFWDVCEYSDKPMVASHSNSKVLCSHRRNLTDEQFAEIVRRGGLVGLNFYKDFLSNEPEKACVESIFEHADYLLSKGGENVLAMGSDFDGSDIPADLHGIAGVEDILNVFVKHNYSSELIEKIFYRNACDFMLKHY